ncbi:LysR family transcriptional regulator [Endozoicomonas sp. Mp262]|uniref:LysR family transcriptional regulator n=1 Tax=Endozoicomonas sp. Mp262 TaxID=2919499 RepID=UPI0021D83686
MNLYRLNLNLLPGLKALLDTQSVSKAARQMCVTQSAMSRTLAQLREALNDPVLVRQGNKIFLSDKALSLKDDVNRVVNDACTIFENQQFEPAITEKTFSIAAGHFALEHVIPDILKELWHIAPKLSFELIQISSAYNAKLLSGEVDLVVGYIGQPMSGLNYEYLVKDRLCAVVDRDHPCARRPLTPLVLGEYSLIRDGSWLGCPHLVGDYLDSLGVDIRIGVKTPNMPIALSMLRATKNILVCSSSAQILEAESKGMLFKELPGNVPEIEYYMAWPEYWEHNRAHRWFREFVAKRVHKILEEKFSHAL